MREHPLGFELGLKSDPIEYRMSFPWLFDLMAEEGVKNLQLGTFFEIYQLPDEWFARLREQADQRGIWIRSVFTSHRELGGLLRPQDPAWVAIARRNFERLIQVGSLVGAESVGCNPGAILRDEIDQKADGVCNYLSQFKELMHVAHANGLRCLTIEPMSCLAEPPTTVDEIRSIGVELATYHSEHLDTALAGYCADVSHGYAEENGLVVEDHRTLLGAAIPWTWEIHLRNTDARYAATMGFGPTELGIIDPREIREFFVARRQQLLNPDLVGYLEIPGPKLGRDYSDVHLGKSLRASLRALRQEWVESGDDSKVSARTVKLAPSIMCADVAILGSEVRELEALGVDMIHVDIMDGRFVPNMPLGLDLVKRLRSLTTLPLDVHLMVEDNEDFISRFLALGVERISFHLESAHHPLRLLSKIRDAGVQAGIALCPATEPESMRYLLDQLDFVLLMTVDPGFAGQPLVSSAFDKIDDTRRFLSEFETDVPILVDGNVSFENIPAMVESGATELVLGSSSLFHPNASRRANLQRIERIL